MSVAVRFPTEAPDSYAWFDNEPTFDPERHLALEEPAEVLSLADLGYTASEIEGKATSVALSSPFRVLSDEGVSVMLDVARRLRPFHRTAGDRIERVVRGGCYRSRWLRDLCLSPDVTAHLSKIYRIEVAPHAMPLHLGHLNYEPSVVGDAIDKWHHDTLPLDYVLPVTNPANVPGGQFEYFLGTKEEAAALAAAGTTPAPERRVAPDFPGAGYAIALHGNMVVHRAAPLTAAAERISMVNGYVAMHHGVDDQSRCADLMVVDDPELLYAEWARFAAWRAQQRLGALVDELPFTADREVVVAQLETAVASVQQAIEEMRAGPRPAAHYEATTRRS